MSTTPRRLGPALLESAGLLLSLYLTAIHFGWVAPESVPCPRGSIFACQSILKGEWSGIFGIPWAVLGLLYFVGHLVLTALGPGREPVRYLKAVGLFMGIAVVMALRGVELIHLRKICPLCWGVAFLTLAQAIGSWSWVPRLPVWPVFIRVITVLTIAFAMLGVALTGLLLQVDIRRATVPAVAVQPVSPTVSPSGDNTPVSSTGETTQPIQAIAAPYTQPIGSPIEGPEVELIRRAGWTVTNNPGLVQEAWTTRAPVLVFAYDPLCEECHGTMRQTLGAADFPTTLGLTLVAVEESALPPELSSGVTKVPTLLLVRSSGEIAWRHEGRIPLPELLKALAEQTQKP